MRILLVCQNIDSHGGWYTYTRLLGEALRDRGHDVRVASQLPSPLDTQGKPWLLPTAARRLKAVVEDFSPDVIHVTVEPYALVMTLLPERWLSRTVMTVHGSYGIRLLESMRRRMLACRAFKRFARFIAVSEYTKNAVAIKLKESCRTETCGNFERHVDVIRNGIHLPRWSPKGKKNGPHQLLLVGGVKPRKGIVEAIDACAAYKRKFGGDCMLHIAGVCDERDAYVRTVRARIAEHGLAEHVRILGSVSDTELAGLYARANLYLMPSPTSSNSFEGYGIAFIEAAAHGLPSIGPNTGGGAEAILEGKTGFRVPVRDAELIAERMHRILDEDSIRQEDCRAWAEEHAMEKRVLEIEHTYALVIRAIPSRAGNR